MRLSFVFFILTLVESCSLMRLDVLVCVSSDNDRSAILEVTFLINEGVGEVLVVSVEVASSYDLSNRSSSRTSARRLLLLNVLS